MPLFKKLMSSIFSSKIFTTVTSLNIPRRILDIYKIGAVTFGVVSFGMMFRDLVRADVFHHHLHKKIPAEQFFVEDSVSFPEHI